MVVRMRHTRSHTGNRRSHHAIKGQSLAVCANCGAKKLKHAVCKTCGKYKGRDIIDMVKKTAKKAAKKKVAAK